MTEEIYPGDMLIHAGTALPPAVVVSTGLCSADWSFIRGSTSAQLGREIEKASWTFFYMAGEIRRSGFGWNHQSRTARAVARVIAAVQLENCNCLEITHVQQRTFLGLPYTSLVAHARHIQSSHTFSTGPAAQPSISTHGQPSPVILLHHTNVNTK